MPSTSLQSIADRLVAKAMSYPGTKKEFPWDHTVVKVNKKIFIFCDVQKDDDGPRLGVTAKLPKTGTMALSLPFAQPTGYGMGKHGWVSASFRKGDEVPEEMLVDWIDESYRAVAPKKVVAKLDGGDTAKPAKRKAKAKKKTKRK